MISLSNNSQGRYSIVPVSGGSILEQMPNAIWYATNGLRKTGRTVVLGGSLTGDTSLQLADRSLSFFGSSGGQSMTAIFGYNQLELRRDHSATDSSGYLGVDSSRSPYLLSTQDAAGEAKFYVNVVSGTTFSDTNPSSKGIMYAGNYANGFRKHSLVDKSFVTGLTYLTVNNGLTSSGSNIRLGGLLTGNTTIDVSNKNLSILGENGNKSLEVYFNATEFELKQEDIGNNQVGYMGISQSYKPYFQSTKIGYGSALFQLDAQNGTVYSHSYSGSSGIRYATDFSSKYTNRSLVDAGYVTGITTNLIDRVSLSYASSLSLNLSSKEQKRFVVSGAFSGNSTFSISNSANVEVFTVDFSANTVVNLTQPSTVRVQSYEVDAGRWNSSTKVLTLSSGMYQLTYSYDGSVYKLNVSDRYV